MPNHRLQATHKSASPSFFFLALLAALLCAPEPSRAVRAQGTFVDKGEEKALKDINTYGCHVISVLEDDEHPPFTYSIGIEQTTGEPEMIVAGLKRELAHWMINEYNSRVRAGERFVPGQRYSGFLDEFDVEVRLVDKSHYKAYFGWGLWLYKGTNFRVLQAVWPTTAGIWPWEEGASDWYRYVQPLLNEPAL